MVSTTPSPYLPSLHEPIYAPIPIAVKVRALLPILLLFRITHTKLITRYYINPLRYYITPLFRIAHTKLGHHIIMLLLGIILTPSGIILPPYSALPIPSLAIMASSCCVSTYLPSPPLPPPPPPPLLLPPALGTGKDSSWGMAGAESGV